LSVTFPVYVQQELPTETLKSNFQSYINVQWHFQIETLNRLLVNMHEKEDKPITWCKEDNSLHTATFTAIWRQLAEPAHDFLGIKLRLR
jgi:hypothetical protein